MVVRAYFHITLTRELRRQINSHICHTLLSHAFLLDPSGCIRFPGNILLTTHQIMIRKQPHTTKMNLHDCKKSYSHFYRKLIFYETVNV